ncbi:MAG TPA: hypothetical protein DEZ08_04665 [Dehalococcoidia bacterium]|nr:hypothetical protein [Dehalococcoidia bacterium]
MVILQSTKESSVAEISGSVCGVGQVEGNGIGVGVAVGAGTGIGVAVGAGIGVGIAVGARTGVGDGLDWARITGSLVFVGTMVVFFDCACSIKTSIYSKVANKAVFCSILSSFKSLLSTCTQLTATTVIANIINMVFNLIIKVSQNIF